MILKRDFLEIGEGDIELLSIEFTLKILSCMKFCHITLRITRLRVSKINYILR